ncbi:MAG: Nramp family divalent metal transporter [bacterium]
MSIVKKNSGYFPPEAISLSEVHRTVEIPERRGVFRRLFAFLGPAYLVSVGYMDPGNWATDIEGGSRFGYQLIWVLLMSNLMAVLLQTLTARLGIVTGRDLAQACREGYPKLVGSLLWILTEIAIIATDLAEVLGTAIGLHLLFGIPHLWGVLLTVGDVMLLLYFQRLGIRKVEAFILALVTIIGAAFVLQLFLAKPDLGGIVQGFIPQISQESLYVALGILGATVMPHNLYLHSALVQTRQVRRTVGHIAQACKYNLIDSAVALNAAFFVNSAILILSASVFFRWGLEVTQIEQAHALLDPLLGTTLASFAFGLALLCSGQSSTLTGTLAGQVVMEGFLQLRMRPWVRRLVTRSLAIIPAAVVISLMGPQGSYRLLILSQVLLSLQLPFAIIPLIHFTSDRRWMGPFVSPMLVRLAAWVVASIITALNVWLVVSTVGDVMTGDHWIKWVLTPLAIGIGILLCYITFSPLWRRWREEMKRAPQPLTREELRLEPFHRIGVALEASPRDRTILSHALPFALGEDRVLVLIHIAEGMGPRFWEEESEDREVAEDRAYLEDLAQEIAALGVKTEVKLGYGEPVEQIVNIAKEVQLDLLVMGQHGHRFPLNIFLGSTASPVRRRLSIPVFTVRV